MEKIYMKYCNSDGDICLVIGDDYDDIYVVNKDKLKVSKITPMAGLDYILEDVDFTQDCLYVLEDDLKPFLSYVEQSKDELDEEVVRNVLSNTEVLK